jgi:hypothetical protein
MHKAMILSGALLCAAVPAAAQSGNSSIQGFGGVTFGSPSALGGVSTSTALGGSVAGGLTPNIQIVAEAGRLSDIKPPLFDLLDLTPANLRLSAWYGEAGVRLIASPRSAARPYAEATAGIARLRTGLSGFGGRTDTVVDTGLRFLNRTEPLLGLGAGVLLGAGPLSMDLGYRYKRIVASGVPSVLNFGNAYQVNEMRIGVGVRF